MQHTGGCQCKEVQWSVELPNTNALACNCSRCGVLGALWAFVPASAFVLHKGSEMLTEYRFNTKKIAHLFCNVCGVESFSRGVAPDGSETVAINVRCVDGLDPKTLTVTEYNGKEV